MTKEKNFKINVTTVSFHEFELTKEEFEKYINSDKDVNSLLEKNEPVNSRSEEYYTIVNEFKNVPVIRCINCNKLISYNTLCNDCN